MQKSPELQQQMFKLIEEWKQSGLSQKIFCEQHSLAPFKFYYWYKRYRNLSTTINSGNGNFVKLAVQKPTLTTGAAIYFPNGVRVVFNEPVSSDYLKKIIG